MSKVIIDKLDQIARYSIEDLYYGTAYTEAIDIPSICSGIVNVIDSFIDNKIEKYLNEVESISFLSTTFPCLIEAFLRRKSLREHEDCISQLFIKTAHLLTLSFLQNIPELHELRNVMFLLNFTQLKFLKVKSSKHNKVNDSFFTEYGKPNVSITANNITFFWPDQWQNEIGKFRSVGHYVQVYLSDGVWYEGKVVRYNEVDDLYSLVFDKDLNKEPIDISLRTVKHFWVDSLNETRIQSSTSQVSTYSENDIITSFRFSSTDEGLFIRIWWARYQKFFYGKVVSYDPISKRHTLIYDDGDVRSYDFSSKQYEIINPPTSLNLQSVKTDTECATIVSSWHQEFLKQNKDTFNSNNHRTEEKESNMKESRIISRPLASEGQNLSIFYLEALQKYIDGGGFDAVIENLRDISIPPSSCRALLLHLQFIYNLRHLIRSVSLKEYISKLKEAIVLSLHRYDSAQFKDMTQNSFQQILFGLRDIVVLGNPQNSIINQELGLLQLNMSAKLFKCSQLQKRYMGLAMIKEEIESAMPRVSSILTKRNASIAGTGKGNTSGFFPSFGNRQTGLRRNDTFGGRLPLTCEELQMWIIDNNIIEEIFGKSLHQDLVARSDSILVFMAQMHKLNSTHLELIWQSCKGAHEADVRVIHHVILLIVPVLDPDLRTHLFTIISSTPYKDFTEQTLYLIKAYTIQALAALREESTLKNQMAPKVAATPDKFRDSKNSNLTQEQQLLGFGVLWQFVQDPISVKKDEDNQNLTDLAISLLVELLEEEFKDSRDLVMQRCLDNIKVGIATPVSLKILRQTLVIFPSQSIGWFGNVVGRATATLTVGNQIEKLQKQFGLLEIIFSDISRYLKSATEQSLESSSASNFGKALTPSRLQNEKVNRSIFIKCMEERLDFLLFILSKSNLCLGEHQTMVLWKSLGENAIHSELLEKLACWFDALISRDNRLFNSFLTNFAHESDPADPMIPSKLSCLGKRQISSSSTPNYDSQNQIEIDISNAFDEGVLTRLFEAHVMKWASSMDNISPLCKSSVAYFCMKLFLFINISNKAIKVDTDGTWYRVGALSGISVLWRISLDCVDKNISETAMALIVELHHRIPPRHAISDTIRESLLQICFRQLSISIQSLRQGDDHNEIGGLISTPPRNTQSRDEDMLGAMGMMGMQPISPRVQSPVQALNNSTSEDWLEDGERLPDASVIARRVTRYIMILRLFINRFHQSPSQLIAIQVLAGRDDSPIMSLTLNASDTVGELRLKVANHFKEPPESIILLKYGKTSYLLGANVGKSIDRLDNDNLTLSQTKFLPQETIVAKLIQNNKNAQSSNASGSNLIVFEDLIAEKDLQGNQLLSLKPLSWMPYSVKDLYIYEMRKGDVVPKLQTLYRFKTEDFDEKVTMTNDNDKYHRVSDYFEEYIRLHPQHIDQLLEMLDGYLSIEVQGAVGSGFDVSSAIWDVLQSLPLHPPLMAQVEAMPADSSGATIRRMLDLSSPYRLLYVLQIIDSLLSSSDNYSSSKVVTDWSLKFLYLGGSEHLVSMIDILSKKCSTMDETRKKHDEKALTRTDVVVLALSMLHKILHRLLMHDPSYSSWQRISKIKVPPTLSAYDPYAKGADERIPSGLVLSSFQARDFIYNALNTLQDVSKLHTSDKVSQLTFCTMIKHTLSLVNGLLISSEEGLDTLKGYDLVNLLRSLCQHSHKQIRNISCQRLFEYFVNIWLLHCTFSKGDTIDINRFSLFEYLFEIVVTITIDNDSNSEQLYTLIGVILILKSHPEMIFKSNEKNRNGVIISSTSIPDSMSKYSKNDLCIIFVQKLLKYTSRETFHSSQSDVMLLGILRIISVLATEDTCLLTLSKTFPQNQGKDESKDLISFLYLNCLFPKSDLSSVSIESKSINNDNEDIITSGIICQTNSSRSLAFTILYQLCQNNITNFCRLLHIMESMKEPCTDSELYSYLLEKHHAQNPLLWDYGPSLLVKDSDSSVGLANQGGTCYMNSFLQQLYNIPKFVDRLLKVNQYDSITNADLMFQLQVLFGNLRISQKCYYDTLPFCKSFMDYDGKPISLSEQKDINEFAGMLFDRLEENAESKKILQETVQGKIVWKTKSTESSYRSEREETFYMLTAEVKDKACLEDSLDLFIAEELFNGDNQIEDSTAGRKVDALRRCAIRQLPSTLIIHLKRFEFDIETMNRKKVNDHITFPMELNMFPYTEEGISSKEYKRSGVDDDNDSETSQDAHVKDSMENGKSKKYMYALRGVVAHVGAIDRGHYYSFIQNRETLKWSEFNDRAVVPFSQEAIPAECFGGEETSQGLGTKLRQNNAYLLFYERIESDTFFAVDAQSESSQTTAANELPNDKSNTLNVCEQNGNTIDHNTSIIISNNNDTNYQLMSNNIMKAVWKENKEFQLHQYLFDKTNFCFQYQLLNSCSVDSLVLLSGPSVSEENKRNIQRLLLFYVGFVLDIVAHGRAKSCIKLFLDRLEEIITRDNAKICSSLIIDLLASDYVIQSPDDDCLNPNTNSDSDVASICVDDLIRKTRKDGKMHPWLNIFLTCPHSEILKSYANFLQTSLKNVRPENPNRNTYITYEKEVLYTLTSTVDMGEFFSIGTGLTELETGRGVSALTKLIDKIITIAERMGREGLARNEGYAIICKFLLNFALMGFEERRMLLAIGTINRMVLSLLSANTVVNNAAEEFGPCIDLVTLLVRSCMIINPESPVPAEMCGNKEKLILWQTEKISPFVDRAAQLVLDKDILPCLDDKDIHAFLNKFFLENAINITATSVCHALQHICWARKKDPPKILEFLADKVGECVIAQGGIKLTYRYYFRVISEMLMGPAVSISAVFDSVIPSLIDKADFLSGRQGDNDPEYIYAVFKLLHRIGTISPGGHSCVMRIKESWKSIRSKFLYHKKQELSYYNTSQSQNSESVQGMGYMGIS